MRNRRYRRNKLFKAKEKARKLARSWMGEKNPDPALIGILTHSPKLCSCWMCGNPRKYFKKVTIQEKRFKEIL